MTEREIIITELGKHTSRAMADHLVLVMENNPLLVEVVVDLLEYEDSRVAWHAAWALQLYASVHEQEIASFRHVLYGIFLTATHSGILRELLKVLIILPLPDNEDVQGRLVERCFTLLADSQQKIAVRVWAMVQLERMTVIYPELIPELEDTIRLVMEDGSGGICAAGRKVLKKLSVR